MFLMASLLASGISLNASEVEDLEVALAEARGTEQAVLLTDLARAVRGSSLQRSLAVARRAVETADMLDDPVVEADALLELGITLDQLEQLDEAADAYLKCLSLRESLAESPEIASVLNNIGVVYQKLGQYDQARSFLQRSLVDYERSNDLLGRAKVTQNLAVINRQEGHHAEALDGFLAVLQLSQELGSDYGIALASISVGNAYELLDRPERGLPFARDGLERFKLLDDAYSVALATLWEGRLLAKLGRFTEALERFKIALDGAQAIAAQGIVVDIFEARSQTYETMGDLESALADHHRYSEAVDKIYTEESASKIGDLRASFEMESRDRKIEHLKQTAKADSLSQRLLAILLLAALAQIAVIFSRYRLKVRASAVIEARNLELSTALAEIKTLQSILPICANCKKIRDDDGDWHQVDAYISARTSTSFSHGICPGCLTELYPDFLDESDP